MEWFPIVFPQVAKLFVQLPVFLRPDRKLHKGDVSSKHKLLIPSLLADYSLWVKKKNNNNNK